MICEIMLGNVEVKEQLPTDLSIFSLHHYYHYLGLKEYKLHNYDKAVENFMMAIKEKNLFDLEQGISNNNLQSEEDEEKDDDDEES